MPGVVPERVQNFLHRRQPSLRTPKEIISPRQNQTPRQRRRGVFSLTTARACDRLTVRDKKTTVMKTAVSVILSPNENPRTECDTVRGLRFALTECDSVNGQGSCCRLEPAFDDVVSDDGTDSTANRAPHNAHAERDEDFCHAPTSLLMRRVTAGGCGSVCIIAKKISAAQY